MEDKLVELNLVLEKGDYEVMCFVSYFIKGNVGDVGVVVVYKMVVELEKLVKV